MNYQYFQRSLAILFLSNAVAAFAVGKPKMDQQTEMDHLMPLYEIWSIDWVCSNPRYRSEVRMSRMDCIREIREVLPHCNGEYRMKIPRNDSKAIAGRLRYRDFMAGYTRCIKKQHKEMRIVRGRR